MNIKAYLQLARPANLLTAMADVLAGYAIGGSVLPGHNWLEFDVLSEDKLLFLLAATIGLYGGGVVFNDVFDAKIDAFERPERPIPSGKVPVNHAIILGASLLLLGIFATVEVSLISCMIGFSIACLAVLYDSVGKHTSWGIWNMGACRALNLLLGISSGPLFVVYWPISFVPFLYIASVTMISKGEVWGGNISGLKLSGVFYCVVYTALAIFAFYTSKLLLVSLLFWVLFICMTGMPLFKALKNPMPPLIGKAVKAGVLGLVLMDACLSVGFGGVGYGLLIVLLLPLSIGIARYFAVT